MYQKWGPRILLEERIHFLLPVQDPKSQPTWLQSKTKGLTIAEQQGQMFTYRSFRFFKKM